MEFKDILSELKVNDAIMLKGQQVNFGGYIKSINVEEGFFELQVEVSNDNEAIGQVIPISDIHMNTVFDSLEIRKQKATRQDLLELIDFSLDLKDEHLFMHFSNLLKEYDEKELLKKQKAKYFSGGRV
jgi:hypothetical protein